MRYIFPISKDSQLYCPAQLLLLRFAQGASNQALLAPWWPWLLWRTKSPMNELTHVVASKFESSFPLISTVWDNFFLVQFHHSDSDSVGHFSPAFPMSETIVVSFRAQGAAPRSPRAMSRRLRARSSIPEGPGWPIWVETMNPWNQPRRWVEHLRWFHGFIRVSQT